ncbi:MAG: outer membrane protein transport protein [Deltaproteobacteria bacterium]|nr:outer membrane protein transport protein [Deltaproteobacteria bacterium]MCB9788151.1 outer membrane protein transport protein [Deltaproteobacteria bacterium]
MSARRRIAAPVLALLALTAGPAAANPLDAFGFGSRSMAMGSATTASVDDYSANYYNPAALAAARGLRFELGYVYLQPHLTMNGADVGVDAHRGFQGGFVLPGELFRHRVAFSIGLFLPDRQITRVRALPQSQARFVLYDNRPQRLVLSSSLAVEIVDGLYIGAGITFLSNARGALDISGSVDLFDSTKTTLLSRVEENLVAVRYPTFGLLWHATDNLRIGLSYREQFSLVLDVDILVQGDIVVDGDPLVEDASFKLRSLSRNLFSPRQLTLGVAWSMPRWLIEFDLTWLQWSRFPAPTASVSIDLDIPDLPFTIPDSEAIAAPDFHDILVPRVGVELLAHDGRRVALKVRGGYFFEPTPARPQPGVTAYLDSRKHGLSAGLGLVFKETAKVFPEPIELDFGSQLLWMHRRAFEKDDPADALGDVVIRGRYVGASTNLKLLF